MVGSYPAERLSTLIGAIYDCVLEPQRWQSVVDSVRTELNFCYAILGAYPLPAGTIMLGVSSGIDDTYLARLPYFGEDVVELWGGDARVRQFPLEEPILQSQVVSSAAWEGSRYFTEWARPQGVIDAVAIGLERNPSMVATLSFGRHDAAGAVTEAELRGLQLMAPHFRRAIAISQLLELQSIAISTFAATLGTLEVGVVLVDEFMTLLHANPSAEAMLARKAPLQIVNGRVVAAEDAAAALAMAVALAVDDEVALGRRGGTGIATHGVEGEPCIIHVLPLRRRESRPDIFLNAAAALFITPADSSIRLPADAFASLFGLTPAEVRICELIVAGLTQKAIAAQLGLAPSTVKTHVLRILEKTGCRRQSALIRLASSLRVPARA
jgi:DNA-binding CsgD family transcriptional regulator/PAS domain-containing protein